MSDGDIIQAAFNKAVQQGYKGKLQDQPVQVWDIRRPGRNRSEPAVIGVAELHGVGNGRDAGKIVVIPSGCGSGVIDPDLSWT